MKYIVDVCDLAGETCKDKILNQDESDIDCGGDQCPKCGDKKKCHDDCDCISGICKNNICFREYPYSVSIDHYYYIISHDHHIRKFFAAAKRNEESNFDFL